MNKQQRLARAYIRQHIAQRVAQSGRNVHDINWSSDRPISDVVRDLADADVDVDVVDDDDGDQ